MSQAVSGGEEDANIANQLFAVVEVSVGFRALHLVRIPGDEGLVEQFVQQAGAGPEAWIDGATEVEEFGFFGVTHQLGTGFRFEVGGAPGMIGMRVGEDDAPQCGGIMTQFSESFEDVGSGGGVAGIDECEAEAVDQKDIDLVMS